MAEGWEQRNLKGDILHRKNDLDIDTINLLGLYEHISFYPLYVCAFLLPTLSLDCFYFICKFRLISLLQQHRGKKQSHNPLITAPSLILLPLTDNRRKKNPCFWDTNYRFCSSFALRCWNPLSNPIKGRRENKVKVLMIMKKGLKLSICNISGESWMRPRGKEKVMTTGWAEIHAVHHNISNLAQLTAENDLIYETTVCHCCSVANKTLETT